MVQDRESVRDFIKSGFKPFDGIQCIKRTILFFVLCFGIANVHKYTDIWMHVLLISNTGISIVFIWINLRKAQNRVIARFICDAITYMYIAVLLSAFAYRIMFDKKNGNIFILLAMLILIGILVCLITFYVKRTVTRSCRKQSADFKVSPLVTIVSVSSVFWARVIFADADISQNTAILIVGIGCMLFSVLTGSMGAISLLKMHFYNYLNKDECGGDLNLSESE